MATVTSPGEPDLKELHTAFVLMDQDQDGCVTASEIQAMLSHLGIHLREEVVLNLVRQASKSGSCLITEAEFLQWFTLIHSLYKETRESRDSKSNAHAHDSDEMTKDLIAAFRVFDRDRNGFITKDELKLAMDLIGESVTDTGLNDMIRMADVDKDGRINYEEFIKMLS